MIDCGYKSELDELFGLTFKTTMDACQFSQEHFKDVFDGMIGYMPLNSDLKHYFLFSRGKFDNFCYYRCDVHDDGTISIYAAKDEYYFERILALDIIKTVTRQDIYNDFMALYQYVITHRRRAVSYYNDIDNPSELYVDNPSLESCLKYGIVNTADLSIILRDGSKFIDELVENRFKSFELQRFAKVLFYHVYGGMIAEENKMGTLLGSSIKINGLRRILLDDVPVDIAATCDCGRNWKEIENECLSHGIYYPGAEIQKIIDKKFVVI